jgi:hypothetical protein
MMGVCEAIDSKTDYFCSYRIRPQNTNVVNQTLGDKCQKKVCILIQGQYIDGFTEETIKFYRFTYPNAIILFSTWNGVPIDIISNIKKQGAIVVESEEPENPGRLNINYQIINTQNGINKAIELGAEYICKVRSDQRMYHPTALSYLISLVDLFPVGEKSKNQNRRIVAVTMPHGSMFQPFYVSDFFYFGTASDIKNLFSLSLDEREKGAFSKGYSKKQVANENRSPEGIIMRHYARYTEQSDECSIESYWNFLKNSLICINRNDVGLFWNKYNEKTDDALWNGYYEVNEQKGEMALYNFDYCNWLALYNGEIVYERSYEEYAEFIFK